MGFIINPYAFGAAAAITSLAIQATSQSDAANGTITCPTVIAGDLIIHLQRASTPSGDVTPTGFTQIRTDNLTTTRRASAAYKIAAGTESGSTITGFTGGTVASLIVTYRADIPITAVNLAGVLSSGMTDGNPTGPTILSGAGVAPLVVFGNYFSNTAIDPRSFTPAKDGETAQTTENSIYNAYKFYASSPANIALDMDDEGSGNCVHGCYLELS